MGIVDCTSKCSGVGTELKVRPATEAIDLIVVHRFGPWLPGWRRIETAYDIAEAFASHEDLRDTIGRMPYHFVDFEDGTVEQAVPLSYYTPHARGYNTRSVAVAVHGDCRSTPPSDDQWVSLVDLCTALRSLYPSAQITGHTPWLPNSSSDSTKVCPGRHLDLGDLHLESLRRYLASPDAARLLASSLVT